MKSKGKFSKCNIPWNKGKKGMQVPWNKNKKGMQIPWNKGLKGTHFSKDTEFKKGEHKSLNTEFKKGCSPWNKGLTKEVDKRVKINANHVKEHHWSKNPKPETIEKMRIARFSQKFPRRFTKIEINLSDALKNKNILFINHKNLFNITEVDIFIEPNICIYCDGDYWHANPKKYDYNKLDSNQKWHVERDQRNNRILKEKGFIVLRFWESDINKDIDKCISTIVEVIDDKENQ